MDFNIESFVLRWPSWWYAYSLSFNLGTLMAVCQTRFVRFYHNHTFLLLLLVLPLLALDVLLSRVLPELPFLIFNSLLLPVVLHILLLQIPIPVSKPFQLLGNYSYEVYLVQGVFLVAALYLYRPLPLLLALLLLIPLFSFLLKKVTSR